MTFHQYIFSVGGDILAVQPPFIFASFNSPSHHSNSSNSSNTTDSFLTEVDLDTLESAREGSGYNLGVVLCLSAAVADSIVNIVQISLKQHYADITKNHLIVSCGAFNLKKLEMSFN